MSEYAKEHICEKCFLTYSNYERHMQLEHGEAVTSLDEDSSEEL
jgi:hypothetical protein